MTACAHLERWAPISVVVVWVPGLPRPRVIPAEGEFRACRSCSMLFDEVDRAVKARGIPIWSCAVVINTEGDGVKLRKAMPAARA